jgi:hypothetical protein
MKIKNAVILLLILVSLASCRKKVTPSWDIDVYAPLFNTTLDFTKIVADSNLVYSPDNLVSLFYQFPLTDFTFDSLADFPDTLSHNYLPSLVGAIIHPGQTFFNFTEDTKLAIKNADVSRVDFYAGSLIFEVNSTLTQNIFITYKIPYATKNGVPLEISEMVPAASLGNTVHFSKTIDISGYSVDMRGPTQLSSNTLTNTTIAVLDPDGNQITLAASDLFAFNVRFKSMKFSYAKGYFGATSNVLGPDTNNIDVFNIFTSGNFNVEAVKLSLDVQNGFGIDASVVFDRVSSINSNTGHEIVFNDPIIGQTLNISRASETFDPLSPVAPSVYSFQLSNSNVAAMLNDMPDKITYKLHVTTNPMGNVSSGNDFVYFGNYLKTMLNFEIPLSLIANDLTLADTVLWDLGEYNGNPSSGKLRFIADNGFPFSANFQIYFLDANNHIADSLLVSNLIEAPALDANYKVIAPKRTEFDVLLPADRYLSFFSYKKAFLVAKFNTSGLGNYVKIYSYYKLKLKLTGAFNYLIET